MPVYLIILIVVGALVLGFLLLAAYANWSMYKRGRPYKLNCLEPEEHSLLVRAYSQAIVPETGTFRGGGVWRNEASLSQLEFQGALSRGRLSKEELDKLLDFVNRLIKSNPNNTVLEDIHHKLRLLSYR